MICAVEGPCVSCLHRMVDIDWQSMTRKRERKVVGVWPAEELPHSGQNRLKWRHADLHRSWRRGSSMPEIIAHDQAENEPTGADRALQRTADFRFSDTRIVANRNFNHAESSERAFEDHLDRPAIGSLFQGERAQYLGAASAKRAEITNV